VCPLVLAQAAEIEALPVERFLTDATKLANGLRALHEAFGNDVIVTAAADGLAAAAAGTAGTAGTGPVTAHPRVAAAVEATRRLAVTAGDAALAVALCGPARLAAQLGHSPADRTALDTCGAVLLALAKAFLEAGANLLLLVEAEALPAASAESWRSAAAPLVNVARFHQAAAVVVLADPAGAAIAPRGAVVCLPPPDAGPGQGIALSTDPAAWQTPPPGAPLVTSLGPVRGGFAECRAAVGMLTAAVAEV
jgi:uroporphyrinogen-III decarboxylase